MDVQGKERVLGLNTICFHSISRSWMMMMTRRGSSKTIQQIVQKVLHSPHDVKQESRKVCLCRRNDHLSRSPLW